jgi:4-hydroxy-tetrahydrodipicolinate reductase
LSRPLNLVVLGIGKTGSLVAQVAAERGHRVQTIDADVNANAAWLTRENLQAADVLIDFTTPDAVLPNIAAAIRASKPMVVGTTGWYREIERIKKLVEDAGTGFVFGANFSYGVNLFFQIMKAAAPALKQGYTGHITETHHVHKKDAPSGTAITLRRILQAGSEVEVGITSIRQGEVTGVHTLELESAGDHLLLTHEARSRRTFAEGAVLAAEWIAGKRGFYEFKDVFAQL